MNAVPQVSFSIPISALPEQVAPAAVPLPLKDESDKGASVSTTAPEIDLKAEKVDASLPKASKASGKKRKINEVDPQHGQLDSSCKAQRIKLVFEGRYELKVTKNPRPLFPVATLQQIEPCNEVESMSISYAQLGVEHMREIAKFPNLNALQIRASFFGEKAIDELQKIKKLRELQLWHCADVDDVVMEEIGKLKELEQLHMPCLAQITKKGFHSLLQLSNLTVLDLTFLNINDKALERIAEKLTKLISLNLSSCIHITDAGVTHLKKLPQLKHVNIVNCPLVTLDFRQKLEINFPGIQFEASSCN
jgi:Leucine-rich repeat (LRR) protein